MASHAVATRAAIPRSTPFARARGGGDGRPSSRGSCLVRDRNPAWRCLPPSRDSLEPVRASPGSCDLYDVSDELTPYAVAWGWQKAILDARLAALSAERDDANEPGFAALPEDAPRRGASPGRARLPASGAAPGGGDARHREHTG